METKESQITQWDCSASYTSRDGKCPLSMKDKALFENPFLRPRLALSGREATMRIFCDETLGLDYYPAQEAWSVLGMPKRIYCLMLQIASP